MNLFKQCLSFISGKSGEKMILANLNLSSSYFNTTTRFTQARTATANALPHELRHKSKFLDTLPVVVDTILSNNKLKEIPSAVSWLKEVLEYNLVGGKMIRGLTTVNSYEILERPENVTEESLQLVSIMGWCTEMLQAYLTMLDDIMDDSKSRRGKPCWYRRENVGLRAVNDGTLMYSVIFDTLQTFFKDHTNYDMIVKLFNETVFHTAIGQYYDTSTTLLKDYNLFTMDLYNTIVKYKTGYYTIHLPICVGMYLANITDKQIVQKMEDVSCNMGYVFQSTDDYIDCFGDVTETGKLGTDIQNGKCTWLAVTALERCTPRQRIVFNTCYGSNQPAHVERIQQLYKELKLPEAFSQYEKRQYEIVMQKAKQIPELPQELFSNLITVIHKRRR